MSVTVLQPGSSSRVRGLATQLDISATADAVSGAVLSTVFPEHANDPTFAATLRRCSGENVTRAVEVLAGRLALSEVDAPCARDFAALVARLGVTPVELERAYRVGVERLWQDWFELCRSASADGLPDLLGGSTSLLFGYVDRVLPQVLAQHAAVLEDMAATCEDRRRELVLRLLDDPAELTEASDAALGYRLRATHVALLFSGGRHREVTRALAGLRERSGAWGTLLVRPDASTWFGWLGYHDGVDRSRLELLRRTATELGCEVAIGEPGRGLEGFRRSNATARRVADLRGRLDRPMSCLCARDLRLEEFLLENPDSARRFVRAELGELAGGGERSARIRATLLASLTAGSHAKAAAQLGIHENTVRMRIRAAVQQLAADALGSGLTDRRTELLVALRLREALGPVGD